MEIFPKSFYSKKENFNRLDKEEVGVNYKDLLFDTKTKKIVIKDGKTFITSIVEEVKQWIFLLIHTEMGKYKVYEDTKFGIAFLYEMRGHEFYSSGFTIAQIKDELREKIILNKNIKEIIDITIKKGFNTLTFDITVAINDEIVNMEVNLDE